MLIKNNVNPKVSVIMSVYNGAKYLDQAIDSILNQTFSFFEFLIIDDLSTDSSLSMISAFAAKDSRIKIIKNNENIGLTKSLNKAIREAKGEYLARIDADDLSYPDRLTEQVAFLDNNKSFALVGSWAEIIDDQNAVLRTVEYPVESNSLKKVLIKYNPFFHSSIMIRKSVLDDVGLYNETYKFAQDYELYFRIAKKYNIANIPAVLIKYREIANSITGNKNRKQIGFVIKAKLKSIRDGQYSKLYYFYMIRSYLAWLLPVQLKKIIKKSPLS